MTEENLFLFILKSSKSFINHLLQCPLGDYFQVISGGCVVFGMCQAYKLFCNIQNNVERAEKKCNTTDFGASKAFIIFIGG